MQSDELRKKMYVFSFKENNFINFEKFLSENENFEISFMEEYFIINYKNNKMLIRYECLFQVNSEYYFITKQKENLFLIDNCINDLFFIEYNIFVFLQVIIRRVFSYNFYMYLFKYFITNKSFVKIVFTVIIFFSGFSETKTNEINDLNSIYRSDYFVSHTVSKLISYKLNLEKK